MTRLLAIASALCCLLCVACTHRDPTITRAEISTEFRHTDGIAGQWDHKRMTVYLGAHLKTATWAHELGHACDSLDLPFDQVLAMAGTLPPNLAHQQATAQAIARDAAKIRHPLAHWIAIGRRHGPQAVGHAEILDQIRHLL